MHVLCTNKGKTCQLFFNSSGAKKLCIDFDHPLLVNPCKYKKFFFTYFVVQYVDSNNLYFMLLFRLFACAASIRGAASIRVYIFWSQNRWLLLCGAENIVPKASDFPALSGIISKNVINIFFRTGKNQTSNQCCDQDNCSIFAIFALGRDWSFGKTKQNTISNMAEQPDNL